MLNVLPRATAEVMAGRVELAERPNADRRLETRRRKNHGIEPLRRSG